MEFDTEYIGVCSWCREIVVDTKNSSMISWQVMFFKRKKSRMEKTRKLLAPHPIGTPYIYTKEKWSTFLYVTFYPKYGQNIRLIVVLSRWRYMKMTKSPFMTLGFYDNMIYIYIYIYVIYIYIYIHTIDNHDIRILPSKFESILKAFCNINIIRMCRKVLEDAIPWNLWV